MNFKYFIRSLTNLFFPQKCALCSAYTERNAPLCEGCLAEYELEATEKCSFCGGTAEECSCGVETYSRGRLGGKSSVALRFYKGYSPDSGRATERLLFRLKRSCDRPLIDFFARDISARIMKLIYFDGASSEEFVLTFPPRSEKNAAKYGFDHAEETTLRIAYYTGISYKNLLGRYEGGVQKKLSSFERFENASRSLYVADRNGARGKRIILFDDIATTGATARAAAELLIAAGAKSVFPVFIAKTPKKNGY